VNFIETCVYVNRTSIWLSLTNPRHALRHDERAGRSGVINLRPNLVDNAGRRKSPIFSYLNGKPTPSAFGASVGADAVAQIFSIRKLSLGCRVALLPATLRETQRAGI